ncbi:hypothetical protein [Paenibacillus sp. YN15]|uniref:hypothetical protein n=1 Tax=Paenibacillus sp. YN15 TaxID=1742774 RepID=UPI0015ECD07F|nr:hypothetical protein [Paenibacillus sp. YN15]
MTYASLIKNSTKQYLGYCEQKGYVYSVQVDTEKYAIVALRDSVVTTLIMYQVSDNRC